MSWEYSGGLGESCADLNLLAIPSPDMSDDHNPYDAPATDIAEPEGQLLVGTNITTTMLKYLAQTRPWVRFLSVIGFIFIGFFAVTAVVAAIALFASGNAFSDLPVILIGLLYVGIGLVYFFPVLFLHRFATELKRLNPQNATQAIEQALGHQKSFWKYVGILTIVSFGLVALTTTGAIVLGIISAID